MTALFWAAYATAGLFVSRWAYRAMLRFQIRTLYPRYARKHRDRWPSLQVESLDRWLSLKGPLMNAENRFLAALIGLVAWPVVLPILTFLGPIRVALLFVGRLIVAFYTKPTLKDRAERMRAEG